MLINILKDSGMGGITFPETALIFSSHLVSLREIVILEIS